MKLRKYNFLKQYSCLDEELNMGHGFVSVFQWRTTCNLQEERGQMELTLWWGQLH